MEGDALRNVLLRKKYWHLRNEHNMGISQKRKGGDKGTFYQSVFLTMVNNWHPLVYVEKRFILVDSFGSSGPWSLDTVVRQPTVVQVCDWVNCLLHGQEDAEKKREQPGSYHILWGYTSKKLKSLPQASSFQGSTSNTILQVKPFTILTI